MIELETEPQPNLRFCIHLYLSIWALCNIADLDSPTIQASTLHLGFRVPYPAPNPQTLQTPKAKPQTPNPNPQTPKSQSQTLYPALLALNLTPDSKPQNLKQYTKDLAQTKRDEAGQNAMQKRLQWENTHPDASLPVTRSHLSGCYTVKCPWLFGSFSLCLFGSLAFSFSGTSAANNEPGASFPSYLSGTGSPHVDS